MPLTKDQIEKGNTDTNITLSENNEEYKVKVTDLNYTETPHPSLKNTDIGYKVTFKTEDGEIFTVNSTSQKTPNSFNNGFFIDKKTGYHRTSRYNEILFLSYLNYVKEGKYFESIEQAQDFKFNAIFVRTEEHFFIDWYKTLQMNGFEVPRKQFEQVEKEPKDEGVVQPEDLPF